MIRASFAVGAVACGLFALYCELQLPALQSPAHAAAQAGQLAKLAEAEWRRRWRALVLVVKAKLEIIASGGSTFEREQQLLMIGPGSST